MSKERFIAEFFLLILYLTPHFSFAIYSPFICFLSLINLASKKEKPRPDMYEEKYAEGKSVNE